MMHSSSVPGHLSMANPKGKRKSLDHDSAESAAQTQKSLGFWSVSTLNKNRRQNDDSKSQKLVASSEV